MAWFRTDPQEVLKETVLWTNPAPTSAFASQTVTLSDDINNYDYLKFILRRYTTDAREAEVIFSVAKFKEYYTANGNFTGAVRAYYLSSTGSVLDRGIVYNSDTSIKFGDSTQIGGTSVDNATLLPQKIIGVKRGIEVNLPFYETELWTNSSPTSSLAGGTIVDLSDDMNNYDFLKFEYRHSTSVATLYNIVVPVNLFKTTVQGDTSSTNQYIVTLSAWASGNFAFGQFIRRMAIRKTDTSVYFTGGGNMGSTTANNANIIPTKIIGIKQYS